MIIETENEYLEVFQQICEFAEKHEFDLNYGYMEYNSWYMEMAKEWIKEFQKHLKNSSIDELINNLEYLTAHELAKQIKPGQYYWHRKGVLYKVIMLTNLTATMDRSEEFPIRVVYKRIHDGAIFDRKIANFNGSFATIYGN